MGRISILLGIGILAYGYYTHHTQGILTLIACFFIGTGAILYFLTPFK